MTGFSPTEAAFEGFRITRDKPGALAIWAVVSLVLGLAMAVGMILTVGPALMELQEAADDQQRALELTRQLAPFYVIAVPVGLIFMSVWAAAVYRVVLRPQETGLGYLRLGSDELRLALLTFIYVVLMAGFFFVAVLAVAIVAGLATAVSPILGGVLGTLAGLAVFPTFVWLSVRLSLAGPMTFARRKLSVFSSWRLTRGQFWRLLGAYLLAVIMALIVAAIGFIVYAVIAVVVTGGDFAAAGGAFEPDMNSFNAYFTPALLVYMVFASFVGVVQYALLYAPGAVAYRALANVEVDETFA